MNLFKHNKKILLEKLKKAEIRTKAWKGKQKETHTRIDITRIMYYKVGSSHNEKGNFSYIYVFERTDV